MRNGAGITGASACSSSSSNVAVSPKLCPSKSNCLQRLCGTRGTIGRACLRALWRAEGQISSRCRPPDGDEFFSERGIDKRIHGVLWMRGEAVWTQEDRVYPCTFATMHPLCTFTTSWHLTRSRTSSPCSRTIHHSTHIRVCHGQPYPAVDRCTLITYLNLKLATSITSELAIFSLASQFSYIYTVVTICLG